MQQISSISIRRSNGYSTVLQELFGSLQPNFLGLWKGTSGEPGGDLNRGRGECFGDCLGALWSLVSAAPGGTELDSPEKRMGF